MRSNHAPPSTNPRTILERDHAVILSLLDRVLLAARACDLAGARLAWDELEVTILAHLLAEETHVLPLLEPEHADELAVLRDQHEALRRRMTEIGLSFDLHIARCDILERLADDVRAHAAREEALCYPLADRKLAGVFSRVAT